VDRLALLAAKIHPARAALQQAQVELSRKLLAAIPALHPGLAGEIEILPFRGRLIGTDETLANSLRTIDEHSVVRELERGLAFNDLIAEELVHFSQAADMMKLTLQHHGQASVGAHSVADYIARSRSVTARLAAQDGRLELVFSIYRHVVSLLDYVQVAVPLSGLRVDRHPSVDDLYFLTAV